MLRYFDFIRKKISIYRRDKGNWDKEISYIMKNKFSKIRFTNIQKEKIMSGIKESIQLGNNTGCSKKA